MRYFVLTTRSTFGTSIKKSIVTIAIFSQVLCRFYVKIILLMKVYRRGHDLSSCPPLVAITLHCSKDVGTFSYFFRSGYNTVSSGRCMCDGNGSLKTINANHAISSNAKIRTLITHVGYKHGDVIDPCKK